MTDLIDDLQWRGLISQSTDIAELRKVLANESITVYAGFDPTADSLHAGNLVPLLTLRRFQQAGHRPILLAGGATGLIGDPSGRSTERSLNTPEQVHRMVDRIRGQLTKFMDFSGGNAAILVNNLDWTANFTALEFLREVGKHFSVNHMLAKEAVASRLNDAGISYTEFSYQILQALDYSELYQSYDCRVQIGGNDQWGNITAGLDYIRKVTGNTKGSTHGLTVPLLTTSTGEKFGKSTGGGALWLDPELTSPYTWYQRWINTEDQDVITWLKMLTFVAREEIEALAVEVMQRPSQRAAQKRLASELTTLVHGEKETEQAIAASAALFGRGELASLDPLTLHSALQEAGLTTVEGKLPSVAVLLKETGLCASLSEARRTVTEGGAYLNNAKVADSESVVAAEQLLHGRWLVLRRGKRFIAGVEQKSN